MQKDFSSYLNKFFIENYMITSPFYDNSPHKILVLTDFHYHINVPLEIIQVLLLKVKELQPDFIVIPGDFIEDASVFTNVSCQNYLISILRELGALSKVIITFGNHELKRKEELTEVRKWYQALENIPNIYFLENEEITFENITFSGFSPSYETYIKPRNLQIKDKFIEEFQKANFKLNKNSYNILLTHSPLLLFDSYVKEQLDFQNVDLTITGHFHDGYLPKALDKVVGSKQIGLYFTPHMSPFKKIYARGLHDYGRGQILIGQGFRRFTHDNFLFNHLENYVANDVEMLSLSKAKTLSYKKQV